MTKKRTNRFCRAGQTVTNQPSLAEDSSDIVDKLGNP